MKIIKAVDKDDLTSFILKDHEYFDEVSVGKVIQYIESCPQIICEHCKHYNPQDGDCVHPDNVLSGNVVWVDEDSFCDKYERRTP